MNLSDKLDKPLLKLSDDMIDFTQGRSDKTLGEILDEAKADILQAVMEEMEKSLDKFRPTEDFVKLFELVGQESCVVCGFSPTNMNNAVDAAIRDIKDRLEGSNGQKA